MKHRNDAPRAVAYARLSQDRNGTGAGVARQLEDIRSLAERLGLTLTEEFVDNDLSATSGVRRPEFERMLASHPPAIVAWHQDRLLRLTRDLERVIDLGVPVYTVHAGTLDLSSPAGRAVARTVAAWSTYEGEQKSLRQRRANVQRAEAGVWQFSRRPFGYERIDGEVVPVPLEAEFVREAYARYIAGDTYYAIADDWNARRVPTFAGPWSMSRVRSLLRNPAYAGLRYYKGEFAGEGNWEALIDRATWDEYLRVRSGRKKRHDWSNQTKHLGSGLYLCGECGARLYARPVYTRGSAVLSYACTTSWCVQRKAEWIDEYVRAIAIARLQDPQVRLRLTPTADVAGMEAERLALIARRDELAELLADGLLSAGSVRSQSARIGEQIDAITVSINAARGDSPISELFDAADVPSVWDGLPLITQRRVLQLLFSVRVHRTSARRRFDPESVSIDWAEA